MIYSKFFYNIFFFIIIKYTNNFLQDDMIQKNLIKNKSMIFNFINLGNDCCTWKAFIWRGKWNFNLNPQPWRILIVFMVHRKTVQVSLAEIIILYLYEKINRINTICIQIKYD